MKPLNEMLDLSRPLVVLDTETTGVDVAKDRIVQVGFQVWEAAGMTKEWRTLVNPGIPIPQEVVEVHGITDAMVQSCQKCGSSHDGIDEEERAGDVCDGFKPWPTFRQLAPAFARGFVG